MNILVKFMKKLFEIIKKIITVFLIVILVINLYSIFCSKILKQDLVSIFGYSNLKIVSGSMQPKIKVGDLIIIKKSDSYEVGDIVTFRDENYFVTHRIIEKTENGIRTKGDFNNKIDDNILTNEDIVGEVVLIISSLGNVISTFNNPLVLIIVFIVGIFVVTLIPSKKKVKQKDKV